MSTQTPPAVKVQRVVRLPAGDRRRQLLAVATTLFARHGYRGTTTAELASAAGITEPILYRHFETKLDLFLTVVDDACRQFLASWREALQGIDDSRQRLAALLIEQQPTPRRDGRTSRVILGAIAESDAHPAIRSALRKHLRTLHTFLSSELGQLQSNGTVRNDQSADALAWLVIQHIVGVGVLSPIAAAKPRRPSDTSDQQHLLDMLMVPT